MPSLVGSVKSIISSAIARAESDGANRLAEAGLKELSGGSAGILDQSTRIEGAEDAVVKTANYSVMDQAGAQPAMIKDADYVVDVILPSLLIALLFVGNAVIVYVIFQYRKRKTPVEARGEELALSATTNGDPQV